MRLLGSLNTATSQNSQEIWHSECVQVIRKGEVERLTLKIKGEWFDVDGRHWMKWGRRGGGRNEQKMRMLLVAEDVRWMRIPTNDLGLH